MRVSPLVASVGDPPVAEAKSWIAGRTFSSDLPLLDLSQAVPSYPPAMALREHLAAVVLRPDASGYPPSAGLDGTRSSVAAHLRAGYGGDVALDHVMITAGCNQSFCLAIGALCAPGDEVVLPVPYYFNHEMWLRANGIEVASVPLDAARGMVPDPAAIARRVTDRTRAIVLVTPNNPCGVVYPAAVIEACYDVAERAGIALILDETYKDFRTTTAAPHRLFERPGWPETLVHLFSFSKVFSLAGYRVGSLIAGTPVLREALKLADCETIGAARVSQEAVTFALEHLGEWAEERRIEMCDRVEHFTSALAEARSGYELVSAGAFFAYVRHPFDGVPARVVARRLADEHNLLTIPGEYFGVHQEQFLRLAFGNVTGDELTAVAQRLATSAR